MRDSTLKTRFHCTYLIVDFSKRHFRRHSRIRRLGFCTSFPPDSCVTPRHTRQCLCTTQRRIGSLGHNQGHGVQESHQPNSLQEKFQTWYTRDKKTYSQGQMVQTELTVIRKWVVIMIGVRAFSDSLAHIIPDRVQTDFLWGQMKIVKTIDFQQKPIRWKKVFQKFINHLVHYVLN